MKASKAILSFALILVMCAAGAMAQTADEIVDRHVKVIGGKDKLASIQSVIAHGTFSMPAMNLNMEFERTNVRPDKMVNVVTSEMGKVITAYDGVTAWTVNEFQGIIEPTAVEGEQADQIIQQANIDGFFVNRAENGVKLEYAGEVEEGGMTLQQVKVNMGGDTDFNAFFDKETGIMVMMKAKVEQAGMEIDSITRFSDYRATDGILSARRIDQSAMGQEIVIEMTKVEYNKPVDDSVFKMETYK